MKYIDYIGIIEKTAVYPRSVDNFDLAYGFLGLIDELNELYKKIITANVDETSDPLPIIKECGDAYWYVTAILLYIDPDGMEVGMDLEDWDSWIDLWLSSLQTSMEDYVRDSILKLVDVAGQVKKFYRDGAPLRREFFVALRYAIRGIYSTHRKLGYSLEHVLQMNYDKLMARRETGTLHGDGDYREEDKTKEI